MALFLNIGNEKKLIENDLNEFIVEVIFTTIDIHCAFFYATTDKELCEQYGHALAGNYVEKQKVFLSELTSRTQQGSWSLSVEEKEHKANVKANTYFIWVPLEFIYSFKERVVQFLLLIHNRDTSVFLN